MLRIIVISLVLANLLLLGIQGSRPAREEGPAVAREIVEDGDIPTIHLFHELVQDQQLMSGNRQCFSLGPFHSAGKRDRARAQLRGIVTGISERQTQAMVEKGYWVFLPPYDSVLEANRALLSLRALGLEDIAIIHDDDEWKNAISLGYFLRQKNANLRARQLQERGFETQVRVSRRAESRYWLDYEQDPGADLLKLDMQDRPNDFTQRTLPCPELGFFNAADKESMEATSGQTPAADPEPVDVSGDGSG